jgi:hypothetical protein
MTPTREELERLLAEAEPLPWRVAEHEYEAKDWVSSIKHRTIETVEAHAQMKGPLPVVAIAYGAPTERGGMTVPVLWLMEGTAAAIVGIMNAAPELLSRLAHLEAENAALVELVERAQQRLAPKYANWHAAARATRPPHPQ